MPHALDPELSCSLQDSEFAAADPAAAVAGDCARRLRDDADGIGSSIWDALRATSFGCPERFGRTRSRYEFSVDGIRRADGAGIPHYRRRSAADDKSRDGRSVGSNGNNEWAT